MDREVAALHSLARRGLISAETAERQINTYLLMAQVSAKPQISSPAQVSAKPQMNSPAQVSAGQTQKGQVSAGQTQKAQGWFLLPLTDAPHHGLMPDLGHVVHRVLALDPIPCALTRLVQQCIPRFRHSPGPAEIRDCQGVLLTLVLGLVLGLYAGSGVKKPSFRARAALFARVHALLTASPEEQGDFCKANEEILQLACMEYLARVLPLHMPAQSEALLHGDPATQSFYRRIPPMCDELRQWLDEEQGAAGWERIRAECAARVERVARLKRAHPPPRQPPHAEPACPPHAEAVHWRDHLWDVPELRGRCPEEYRLLGIALGLQPEGMHLIQQEIRVTPLPANLRRIQLERLWADGAASMMRRSYLQSRLHICMRCMMTQRPNAQQGPQTARMRLDTLTQRLVCATCLTPDPLCVNLVGRVLQYRRGRHYYLCPGCATVQVYRGEGEQPWAPGGGCGHREPAAPDQHKSFRRKERCLVCSEHCLVHTARRVDHLTGEMLELHFCQRHCPRPEQARKCVNARQMTG